jgi:hypothetical protein
LQTIIGAGNQDKCGLADVENWSATGPVAMTESVHGVALGRYIPTDNLHTLLGLHTGDVLISAGTIESVAHQALLSTGTKR